MAAAPAGAARLLSRPFMRARDARLTLSLITMGVAPASPRLRMHIYQGVM